jgi:hypothetical protein
LSPIPSALRLALQYAQHALHSRGNLPLLLLAPLTQQYTPTYLKNSVLRGIEDFLHLCHTSLKNLMFSESMEKIHFQQTCSSFI